MGLTDRLEARLDVDPVVWRWGAERETGVGDITLGVKYRFLDAPEAGWWPSLGIMPVVKVPVARSPIGSERVDFGVVALASAELPSRLSLDANVGLAALGQSKRDAFLLQGTASSALTRELGEQWAVYVEAFYASPEERDGRDLVGVDAGIQLYVTRRVVLAAAATTSRIGPESSYSFRAGLAIRFGREPKCSGLLPDAAQLFLRHHAALRGYPVTQVRLTDRLTDGVRTALAKAGLPEPAECAWEIPRQAEHGDYATNVAMVLARVAKRAPRQIADLVVKHFPSMTEVERVEVAGPGFLNVFLAPSWCTIALGDILAAGSAYGRGESQVGRRIRLEFVSANPTGPLVIVNARAAAVGDALARLLRAQGARVTTEFYINDAGSQFEALARSFEARVKQEFGVAAVLPENGYPGEYLIDLARAYRAEGGGLMTDVPEPERLQHFGRYAVRRMVEGQRETLREYGVEFDVWSSEQHDVRDKRLPAQVLAELASRGLSYERDGALWFRSSEHEEAGDDKDRVLRRSNGEPTYFGVDVAYHHYVKFATADRLINLVGPDHHGYVARMRAAMQALGHPPDTFEVMIVQLVTLLRDGQPVRMSKRRGEFVLMEELLEEVGRDAARFTFLTRRHDSPLEFDLAVAARQTNENPVYYVQYAHARIRSIFRQAAEQGIEAPAATELDTSPLVEPAELALIKLLLQFPEVVNGSARALEPHRIAYYLQELAAAFHGWYRNHRVIQDDVRLLRARMALCAAVATVVRNGLGLLGVGAPESM